jgi:hypothetical protein
VVWSRFSHRKLLGDGAPAAVRTGWFGSVGDWLEKAAHPGCMAADRRNANLSANPWGLEPFP